MVSTREVAIVGGGIVGLASALGALEAGTRVRVFDHNLGRGATYAAAGMLSPGGEFLGGFQPDYETASSSFALWPSFAESLGVSLYRCETAVVGWSFGDRQDIARYLELAAQSGVSLCDSPASEFALSPRVTVSAVVEREGFVDVDEVVSALHTKLTALGVTFVHENVQGVDTSEGNPIVHTASNAQRFDRVIVATGASTTCLPRLHEEAVQAVRGVTLRVQLQPGNPAMLRGFIDGRSVYLVRRPNGVTVIGATSDFMSEAIVQSRDVHDLIALAAQIVPEVQDARFLDARAGLRPVSRDGLAFFERITPKVGWTSGYFRHGVLMAPAAKARAREFVSD